MDYLLILKFANPKHLDDIREYMSQAFSEIYFSCQVSPDELNFFIRTDSDFDLHTGFAAWEHTAQLSVLEYAYRTTYVVATLQILDTNRTANYLSRLRRVIGYNAFNSACDDAFASGYLDFTRYSQLVGPGYISRTYRRAGLDDLYKSLTGESAPKCWTKPQIVDRLIRYFNKDSCK